MTGLEFFENIRYIDAYESIEMGVIRQLSNVNRWKRPVNILYPNVWHRFETKSRSRNGVQYKIKIQDVDEDRIDEVCEFMENYYYPEEPLSK